MRYCIHMCIGIADPIHKKNDPQSKHVLLYSDGFNPTYHLLFLTVLRF